MPKRTWYEANMSGDQGLVIEDATGRSVAVTYDKEDAALVAAAPELLNALLAVKARVYGEFDHPALMAHGPLGDRVDDIALIVEAALRAMTSRGE